MFQPILVASLFGVFIAQGGALVLSESTPIQMGAGLLVSATISIISVVIWATCKIQKAFNRFEMGDVRMANIENNVEEVKDRLTKIEEKTWGHAPRKKT